MLVRINALQGYGIQRPLHPTEYEKYSDAINFFPTSFEDFDHR